MQVPQIHKFMRFAAVGLVLAGGLAVVAGVFPNAPATSAQINPGMHWLIQPGAQGHVGIAFCNADRTVEYWAYVDGVYKFAGPQNGPGNRWHLDAEYISNSSFANFAEFKAAVLGMSDFQGKGVVFQSHSVVEEFVAN